MSYQVFVLIGSEWHKKWQVHGNVNGMNNQKSLVFWRRIVRRRLVKIDHRKLWFSHFWIFDPRESASTERVLDPSQCCFATPCVTITALKIDNTWLGSKHTNQAVDKPRWQTRGGGGKLFKHFLPLCWSNLKRACKVRFLMMLAFIQEKLCRTNQEW